MKNTVACNQIMKSLVVVVITFLFGLVPQVVAAQTVPQNITSPYSSYVTSSYQRPVSGDITELPRTGPGVPVAVTTVTSDATELPQTGTREVVWVFAVLTGLTGIYFKKFGTVALVQNPQLMWQKRQLSK
jgi:hypothetical protein